MRGREWEEEEEKQGKREEGEKIKGRKDSKKKY